GRADSPGASQGSEGCCSARPPRLEPGPRHRGCACRVLRSTTPRRIVCPGPRHLRTECRCRTATQDRRTATREHRTASHFCSLQPEAIASLPPGNAGRRCGCCATHCEARTRTSIL